MLVLKRHKMESIIIGGDVEVVITDVGSEAVEIGVIAPKSMPIYRKEAYESIHHEKAPSIDNSLPILSDYYLG